MVACVLGMGAGLFGQPNALPVNARMAGWLLVPRERAIDAARSLVFFVPIRPHDPRIKANPGASSHRTHGVPQMFPTQRIALLDSDPVNISPGLNI